MVRSERSADRIRRVATAVALVALVGATAACAPGGEGGAASGAAPAPSTTENPYGAPVAIDPPGADDIVLTVVGPAGERTYTLGMLSDLGLRQVTLSEPFVKQTETFSVVDFGALLSDAGITGDALIETVALNDYTYTNSVEAFVGGGALLAVALDGSDIPLDRGGPVRIVFPDDAPGADNLDAWNWSLSSIRTT
jgi:hypothetical protein